MERPSISISRAFHRSNVRTTVNPLQLDSAESIATSVNQVETLSTPALEALRPGTIAIDSYALSLKDNALAGGSNQFPADIETVPYFKDTYGALSLSGTYNTQGQHIQARNVINCYSVGDCLAGSQFITASGGYRDEADEGTHPFDLQVAEDSQVFTGVCSSGCATGSTTVAITASTAGGTQGDGRFLIDKNSTKDISTGTLTGGGRTIFATAIFNGTSFPSSVFLQTAQAATSQPANLAPGTVTLPIATSGVPTGFATSTTALPTSGVACVADVDQGGTNFPNYEMGNYSVIDATHVQLTLNKVHNTGAAIAVGGLCGYGLEQTVDTTGGIRQLFPVVGSINATSLYYAEALTPVVGISPAYDPPYTSGYLNLSAAISSLSRASNVVTLTTVSNLPADLNGLTLTVSGATDSSYNGTFAVTTTGPNTLTYANTGANSTSSGGTLGYLTGGYVLYPMAEVLNVVDPANQQVDGHMTLAPNTVAWASGDAVEEPHYYQQLTNADIEFVTQYVPRPIQYASAGKQYQGNVGPGLRGWQISNGVPAGNYLGGGGTHGFPDDAYNVSGVWNNDMEADAGMNAVLKVHCNLHGCNRWDSTYALFDLDSQGGRDFLFYLPQSDAMVWNLAGQIYSFSPTSFTANTINVGTLNATTIASGVTGSAITSGTVSAARLPVFGPSGSTHAAGIVPDPGATAGATRFLREDGTWGVPGIANTTTTVGTTMIGVNSCSSATAVTMTGMATTSTIVMTPNADVSGVTGWGVNGGLTIDAWPTANTLNYKVCNQTSSSITPGSSVTFNVSAR
jgi:hypothetical protein